MSKFDYETEKYEVSFNIGNTPRRGKKFFDNVEEAVEYAKSIKERNPAIYEVRKMVIDF